MTIGHADERRVDGVTVVDRVSVMAFRAVATVTSMSTELADAAVAL